MSVLKYKDPVTGEVKTVGAPSVDLGGVAQESTAQEILAAVNSSKGPTSSAKSIVYGSVKSGSPLSVSGCGIAYIFQTSTSYSQTITIKVDGVEVYNGDNDVCTYQHYLPVPFNTSFELTGSGSSGYTAASVVLY